MNCDEGAYFLSLVYDPLLTSLAAVKPEVRWRRWVTLKKFVAHDGRNGQVSVKSTLVLLERNLLSINSIQWNPFNTKSVGPHDSVCVTGICVVRVFVLAEFVLKGYYFQMILKWVLVISYSGDTGQQLKVESVFIFNHPQLWSFHPHRIFINIDSLSWTLVEIG